MKLDEFFKLDYPIYAHTGKSGCGEELLKEHIERCQTYLYKLKKEKETDKTIHRFWKKFGLSPEGKAYELATESFEQTIFFHDLGKIRPAFQKYVMNNKKMPELEKENNTDTAHSLLSSIIYLDYYLYQIKKTGILGKKEKKVLKRIIWENAFIISRHHGDLVKMDAYLCSFESSAKRLVVSIEKNELPGGFQLRYLNSENLGRNIGQYEKACDSTTQKEDICFYFYCRFLYSILVACDFYATTDYVNKLEVQEFGKAEYGTFQELYEKTERVKGIRSYEKEKYATKSWINTEEINDLRCEMFLDAEKNLQNSEENIFFLEAPTGGGKSNTAMNLSFILLKSQKKMFYIYPFNTLVEQNLNTLQELFNEKEVQNQIVVVNSITPIKGKGSVEDNPKEYYERALLDRQFLNYPFILSTHVSLFATLFSTSRVDIFAFYQLTDSIVVLDEIQSYRNAIWAEIIIFLQVCAEVMGMKIIIMSATLPGLDFLAGENCRVKRLLPDAQKYFQHPLFKTRVQISYELLQEKMLLESLSRHVLQNKGSKILVTFIKKKSAYAFFELMCQEDLGKTKVQLITGDDSMYDREKILRPIRKNLVSDIILISTQVVEAGVDIDMDIGYKDISKLDSEEQFLGRINRSCKNKGLVYFFDMDAANQIYADDYRINKDLTLDNEEMRHILENKDFGRYYQQVMQILKDRQNKNTGEEGLENFFKESVKKLNFPAVEERMRLINEDNWHMSIVLCRKLELESGKILDGGEIWETYKILLMDYELDYAEKSVKLSEVKSQLSHFIYQIKKNPDLPYDDILGELICIHEGEKYFENGKLNKKKLEEDSILFIE